MSARYCLLAALLTLTLAAAQNLVSNTCMGCICEAASGCDLTAGCSGGVCGPFRITAPYWQDANITQDARYSGQTFQTCASEPICSAVLVNSYMQKYNYDCDGDGRASCRDYAFIHLAGPGGCQQNARYVYDTDFWRRFQACLAVFPSA